MLDSETDQDRMNPNLEELRKLKNDLVVIEDIIQICKDKALPKDVMDAAMRDGAKVSKKIKELEAARR